MRFLCSEYWIAIWLKAFCNGARAGLKLERVLQGITTFYLRALLAASWFSSFENPIGVEMCRSHCWRKWGHRFRAQPESLLWETEKGRHLRSAHDSAAASEA
jgi:hypothetical protein